MKGRLASVWSSYRRVRLAIAGRLDATPMERYVRDGHNNLITKNLNLGLDSTVVDFGGYLGDWTAEIVSRYGARVHVFEPVPAFASHLRRRFESEDLVTVHQVAVGSKSGTRTLNLAGDATGVGVVGTPIEIAVVDPAYLADQLILRCDLAAINIEGGEYELLPALYEAGFLASCQRLFIQFHQLDKMASMERESCHALLAVTHRCDWDYPFVWESWSRS